MTAAFLGVDIGTSGLKLIVVDDTGTVLARASASYSSSSPSAGWVEQDPRAWVEGLGDALAAIDPTIRGQICAVAAVGHVPTLVLVDADGSAVRPAITWQDVRAHDEATRLHKQLGSVLGDLGTELPWSPSQLIPKLAWIAEHEPEVRARTRWIFQPKDYVNYHLTGVACTDPWSSKGICDVRDGNVAMRLLATAGWGSDACPPTRAPWESLATILPQVADALGLSRDVHVATGWTDALSAMLAVGVFDSPRGFVLTGTSNIVGVSRAEPAAATGLYAVPAGPAAPLPLLYGPTQSGGEALGWAARLLGISVTELVGIAGGADADNVPVFVPYLRGERAPLWNPDARGLVVGLSADQGPEEFARAVVDGVAFGARHVLELAGASSDAPVDIGGVGSDDPTWAGLWAAALGRPLRLHAEAHLSALGAALLAARAHGMSSDEIARLRQQPVEFSAADPARADAAYRDYLDASRVADEWSRRERTRN